MNSRVWNRGKNEYSEKFKKDIITIPAGKFVLMNTYDAAQFKGQYPGKGVEKMLEIEDLPDKGKDQEPIICNFCGESFDTAAKLNDHIGIHKPALIPEDDGKGVSRETVNRRPGRPRKAEAINDSGSNIANSKGSD